jgi:hypothetical protein
MFEKLQKILEENWKVILAAIGGTVLGGFVFGKIINEFSIGNQDGLTTIAINRNLLPASVDVTGEWVYAAETNNNEIGFSEDRCRKRFGTVYINQKAGSYEINLSGERKIKEGCSNNSIPTTAKQVIRWNSENAVVLVNDKKLFVWLKTEDDMSRYGYVSATIIKNSNDIKPTKIQGVMYYLENSKNTWFRAKIDFYRSGSQEAKDIEKKW